MAVLRWSICTVLTLASILATTARPALAATIEIDCDAGASVNAVLSQLAPGDTLVVNGTCHESVVVPPASAGITLDGRGQATLVGTEDASVVLQILGREITVHGFTITGGRNGMTILRGASAIVDGNTIENSGAGGQPGSGLGINVGQHSFASITNNTIRNHRQIGILVHERSSARIGFFDVAAIGAPNLIENNAGAGIQASRGSTIRVVATTIRGNSGDGILVERGSEAEVANNEISGNGGSAIAVVDGSGLDVQIGAATETAGNRTAAGAPNGAFGIQCTVGGYVDGARGTLMGQRGPTDFDGTCVNHLAP